jgi:hypothetical protein
MTPFQGLVGVGKEPGDAQPSWLDTTASAVEFDSHGSALAVGEQVPETSFSGTLEGGMPFEYKPETEMSGSPKVLLQSDLENNRPHCRERRMLRRCEKGPAAVRGASFGRLVLCVEPRVS